jgi:cytochrome P450
MKNLSAIIRQTVSSAAGLPNGYRHAVIAACMVAMYLSKDSANTPRFRAQTYALARAGGLLTKLLLPAARLWRAINARQNSRREVDTGLPAGLRLPSVVQTFMFWRSPFAYYDRCRHRYGDLFTLQATSHPPFVFFSDPEDIRAIITAPADVLHPGEGADTIRPLVGDESFMLLDEDDHLHGRRAILPALQKRTILTEADWVIDSVQDAVASWPRDIRFALHPRLRTLTLSVILRRIFACRGHESEERLAALQDRVLAMLEVTASVVLSLPILRQGPGRTIWERFLLHRSEADELIWSLIDERSHLTIGDDGNDVLSRLLAARNPDRSPMSRRQLRDNIMTMIVSGHETASAELAWAFQLLAHNPRVQRQLVEEIDGDGGDEYLTATVQEVLRHRPVFLFTVPRTVKQPIEIGGRTYRPPTHLLGCTYLLHHNPQIYPQPDEFRPERFLEGQPSPHTWMAWGGGRRRCPGQHLAMLEMVTVLRTVLQDMTILPASRRMERPRWRSVIVTPHAGSRVVLHRRERRRFVGGQMWSAAPAPLSRTDLESAG